MGILETLNAVKDSGFNPATDSVAKDGRLEAGNYPVRLKSVERAVSKSSNREQIAVKLEVVSGEFKDRTETFYLAFGQDLPDFVLEKNGRLLLKLAEFAKVKFNKKDLVDEESTVEALQRGIGNQFLLKLTVSPNRKDPSSPYRNYDFDSLDSQVDDSIDIEEDDLPF